MNDLLARVNQISTNSLLATPNTRNNKHPHPFNTKSPLLSPTTSPPQIDTKGIQLKQRIQALHDWYDRCAIRNQKQVKKALRDRTLYDSKTIGWLKKRAPRRARVQMREQNRRNEARLWFEALDFDGSGEISVAELKKPLIAMGFAKSVKEVQDLVDSVDDDGSGEIGFEEFLQVLGGGASSKERPSAMGDSTSSMSTVNSSLSSSSTLSSTSTNHGHRGLNTRGSVSSTRSGMSSRSGKSSSTTRGKKPKGNKSGGKGGAIKQLHTKLENGELGDTTHMELETLLLSYQRSVLTDALFSRGYRMKGMDGKEKKEHQRTVDALYDSYVYDQEEKKKIEKRKMKAESKRLKKLKRQGIDVNEALLKETEAKEEEEEEQEHHQHNHLTHEYIPKGGRLKANTTAKELENRLKYAGRHVHRIGDLRDHYRDEMMIERLKEDTHNKSLHAPWTRSSMGFDTAVFEKSKEQKMKEMREARRKEKMAAVASIPQGMNPVLHKLLIGKPLQTVSRVPKVSKLIPIKVALNSAFLSAKRSKMLQTPSTDFFRTQKRHHRLKSFRDRNVDVGC